MRTTAGSEFLGIEIGGTKLQIVAGSPTAGITRRWRTAAHRAGGGAGISKQIAAGLKEMTAAARPAAVGVGFGGPVDWRSGTICKSHQIEGWDGFPLAEWIGRETGVRVAVDNDANVGALGEWSHLVRAGAAPREQLDPLFYVTLGSGVGGGLVVDGAIYHGAPPGESEFGHMCLDRDGTIVESRCSGWAVNARIRRLKTEAPESLLARSIGDESGGESRYLAAALAAGDPAARRVLHELVQDLAFAFSHVVHLLHPRVLVMGGGLALVGEPLRRAVSDALPSFVMHAFHPVPEVRLAALREDAVPMGALELASWLRTIASR